MKILFYLASTLLVASVYWGYHASQLAAAKNNRHSHIWFAAVKHHKDTRTLAYTLASNVEITWEVRTDFTFIGDQSLEPYWDKLVLLGSDTPHDLPIQFSPQVEDAYLAKLDPFDAPPLALSFFQFLHNVGLWRNPAGQARPDVDLGDIRSDIGPTRESVQALFTRPVEQKPMMVNFLKFYDQAQYAKSDQDSKLNISGLEAYNRYGDVANRTIFSLGGAYILGGRVESILRAAKSGVTTGSWDEIAVMQYPNPTSILTMENSEQYRAALKHRNAGLERTVIIAALAENDLK